MGNIAIEAKPKDKTFSKQDLITFYERMELDVINKDEASK